MAEKKSTKAEPKTDPETGEKLSSARGTGTDPTSDEGFDRKDADTTESVTERGVEKFSTVGDGVAPSPPGFKQGDHWNSDDARKAYEAEGTSLEAEQRKGAEGEPAGSR